MNKPERRCVHELIAATAAATPDAIALVAGSTKLTYRDLNARANQLARFLRANGVGPEVLVGLSLRSTAEMLVGMLGILKAGGAYVPLDPSYPTERLSFMIQDSRAKILVTTADLAKTGPVTDARVVRLDTDWSYIEKGSRVNFDSAARSHNLAYVIYTSGSTGKPKGVMVTHSGLANYLLWAMKEYGPEAQRSALVHSSISFDLTITGLFTPLLLGGRVELLPEDTGVEGLLMALRGRKNYGLVKITPAHLELLRYQIRPQQMANKVGAFVIGGENLTAENLRFWREFSPSTRLINEYGPTETVVGCCTYEVGADDRHVGSVPIGKPIDNTQLHVLDEELRPLPAGIAGELYIGGAGVARGYLNLPELTEERFVADPFSGQPNARLYRTGDLVRCSESGIFEYLGRLDDQVKLRGYRIELGEVEATIAEHPAIRQGAAMVQIGHSGHKRLVAYAVRRENHAVSQALLREYLIQKLPNFMVPSSIVFLDALPLTSNGKVNRPALPHPENVPLEYQRFTRDKADDSAVPADTAGQTVALTWHRLTGSPPRPAMSFEEAGGDSLGVIEIIFNLERMLGVKLPMSRFHAGLTAEEFAREALECVSADGNIKLQIPSPIFFFLPGFGTSTFLRDLRRIADGEFCFVAVEYPDWRRGLVPGSGSCSLIDTLRNQIRAHVPSGPVRLAGYSLGGRIAYAVAMALEAEGREVGFLGILDAPASGVIVPGMDGAAPSRLHAWWWAIYRLAVAPRVERNRRLGRALARPLATEWAAPMRRLLIRSPTGRASRMRIGSLSDWTKYHLGDRLLSAACTIAISHYRRTGQKLAAPLALFRCAGWLSDAGPDLGWENVAEDVTIIPVPGDHWSTLSQPHVKSTATEFVGALAVIEESRLRRQGQAAYRTNHNLVR